MSRDLRFELNCAYAQFVRYGGCIDREDLMDIIWLMTNINDDLAHGRNSQCIQSHVNKAKVLLDRIVDESK